VIEPGGYGFTIPTTATINGISVVTECQGNTSSPVSNRNFQVALSKDGSSAATSYQGGDVACGLNTDVSRTYGSSTDLWGTTWTPAQVNASTFEAWAKAANAGGGNRLIDNTTATIYYTPAGSAIIIGETRRPGGALVRRLVVGTPQTASRVSGLQN
jgi:hypothetical protein